MAENLLKHLDGKKIRWQYFNVPLIILYSLMLAIPYFFYNFVMHGRVLFLRIALCALDINIGLLFLFIAHTCSSHIKQTLLRENYLCSKRRRDTLCWQKKISLKKNRKNWIYHWFKAKIQKRYRQTIQSNHLYARQQAYCFQQGSSVYCITHKEISKNDWRQNLGCNLIDPRYAVCGGNTASVSFLYVAFI